MFKTNVIHRVDSSSLGCELGVQYQPLVPNEPTVYPAGLLLSVYFFSRVYEIGFWW